MKTARKDFVSIKGIVNGVLRKVRARSGPRARAEEIWTRVVGEELAALARVSGVSADAVEIEVTGAAARAELSSFYRDRYLKALKDAGLAHLRRVHFTMSDARQEH